MLVQLVQPQFPFLILSILSAPGLVDGIEPCCSTFQGLSAAQEVHSADGHGHRLGAQDARPRSRSLGKNFE